MKKLVLFLALISVSLVSCTESHTHNYSAEFSKDDKNHWYACECGDKKDEVAHDYKIVSEESKHWYECECGAKKDEAAHDFNIAGTIIKKPGCEHAGIQVYSCKCGANIEKEVPATGHQFNNLETNWSNYVTEVKSDAQDRYQIIAHTSDNGLYLKIEQYVDQYVIKEDPSDWNSTHVEMELWNHCIGYGWDGTYFAFFADGRYYINNWDNCTGVYNCAEIIENPVGSTYKYTIRYDVFIAFENNLDNPQDGSYAFCQFMFYTPGEDNTGYENATTITKDGWRTLWTDKCNSYEIHSGGITVKRMD